jgi:multidrug transporter EmrE-like cation transporter
MRDYLYILGTVVFTVYGQLIIKWQISRAGPLPEYKAGKLLYLLQIILNGWVISSLFSAFLAFLCWVAAMTKFEISYAYPFMSLCFVSVLILSFVLFNESLSLTKLVGTALVVLGIIVASRG